jgi:hypothetical protein
MVPWLKKNRVRAKSPGCAQRHRRLDPIFSRFVAGCGNDAALIRLATHHDGFAAQLWPVQQLYGNEKCVHIDVENGS